MYVLDMRQFALESRIPIAEAMRIWRLKCVDVGENVFVYVSRSGVFFFFFLIWRDDEKSRLHSILNGLKVELNWLNCVDMINKITKIPVSKLSSEEIQKQLLNLSNWKYSNNEISKEYKLGNFEETWVSRYSIDLIWLVY